MIEIGSNNCYEASGRNPKRARNWWADTYVTEGKFIATKEEIIARIDAIRTKIMERSDDNVREYKDYSWKYDDKHFGWHASIAIHGKGTSGTSFGMFKGYYLKGMEQALTIEQLIEKNVQLQIRISYYSKESIAKAGLEVKPDVTIKSTEHLLEVFNEYKNYYGELQPFYFTYNSYWAIYNIINERKRANKKARKERIPVLVSEYFVFRCKTVSGYLVKNTRRGFKYSPFSTAGRMFANEKTAIKVLSKMKNKDLFQVEKIVLSDGRKVEVYE
jgi:hypothetical protein